MSDADLVVVALPGVQRFIAESRTTADAAAASRIVSSMTEAVVAVAGAEVVFPAPGAASAAGMGGLPNRVVALCPRDEGKDVAGRMQQAVTDAWRDRSSAAPFLHTRPVQRGHHDRVQALVQLHVADVRRGEHVPRLAQTANTDAGAGHGTNRLPRRQVNGDANRTVHAPAPDEATRSGQDTAAICSNGLSNRGYPVKRRPPSR